MSGRYEIRRTRDEIFVADTEGGVDLEWWAFSTDAAGKLHFTRKDGAPPSSALIKQAFHVDAIYGAFKLLSGYYIAVVTRSQRVATGPYKAPIFQVQDMKWIPVHRAAKGATVDGVALTPEEAEEEEIYLALLREISETASFFYAGGGYDLTNSLQRNDYFTHAHAAAAAGGGSGHGVHATFSHRHIHSGDGSASALPSVSGRSRAGSGAGRSMLHMDSSASIASVPTGGAASSAHAGELPAPPVGALVTQPNAAAAAPATGPGADGPIPIAGIGIAPAAAHAVDAAHSDERFFWNRRAASPIIAAGHGARAFVTPIINGFVQEERTRLGDTPVRLLLVTRRGCARQGTRFNMRGADSEGNVANYAETEQVVTVLAASASASSLAGAGAAAPAEERVTSFVQIRGSIPLLWEQPVTMKYTPRVRLLEGPNTAAGNAAVFGRHMRAQLARYGTVTAVNLIDKKKDQLTLGKAFEAAAAAFSAGLQAGGAAAALGASAAAAAAAHSLRFVWFDFHAETKKGGWGELRRLVDMIAEDFAAHGMYAKDGRGAVTGVQRGVFRTNCMDNLDRTNVVQSLLARRAALQAVPGAWAATERSGCSVLTSPFPDFERAFNGAWADNADAVSMLYAGTGALKTDFTRTGKRTLRGAVADGVNSIKRYLLNNLNDGRTQDSWDLFIGRYVPLRHHIAERGGAGHADVVTTGAGAAAAATPAAHGNKGKAARVRHVTPLKAHLSSVTPLSLLSTGLLAFIGVAAAVSYFAHHLPLPGMQQPTAAQRLAVGFGAAAVAFAGLLYALMSKGVAVGKQMVSRPQFVRHDSAFAALASVVPAGAATPAHGHEGPAAAAAAAAADEPVSARAKMA